MGRHSRGSIGSGLDPASDRAIAWVRDVTALAERLAADDVHVERPTVDYSSALWPMEVRGGSAKDRRYVEQPSSDYQVKRFQLFWSSRDQELIVSTAMAGVLSVVENWRREFVEPCESFGQSLQLAERLARSLVAEA